MKINHRLTLMVVLPLVFLLGFAAKTIFTLSMDRANATLTYENARGAIIISDLIHAIQSERGLSVGFVGSGGETFRDVLAVNRSATDERISKYKDITDAVTAFDPNLARTIETRLGDLSGMRRDVDSLIGTSAGVAEAYTQLIDTLTDASVRMARSGKSVDLTNAATAYAAVMHAKENAGLQRATGVAIFSANTASPERFERFVSLGANKDTFLYEAEFALGKTRWSQIASPLASGSAQTIADMRMQARTIAFGSNPLSFSSVSAAEWFEATTRRIDELKTVEDAIGEEVYNLAKAEASASTTNLLLVSSLCLIIVAVSGAFAFWQSRQIAQPLARFVQVLRLIRDHDYSEDITDTKRKDEIGECARAMNEVQTNLKAAAATQLENHYKGTAFARANTPMFIVDSEFVMTHANNASVSLFRENADLFRSETPGFDPENLIGQKLTAFEVKLADRRGEMANPDAPPIKRDLLFSGSRIGVEIAGIFDDDGAYLGNVFSWSDVSIARTNASKLEAVDASQAVVEFDLDGKVLTANEKFLSMTGYRLDEIIGKHQSILAEPEYAQSDDYKAFWQKLTSGDRIKGEFKRVNKKGEEFWLLASYSPVLDDNGVPFKVVKFATEITEEKTRQAEIASQLLAIGKSQAVFEFDLNGTVLTANDNFLEIMGCTQDTVVGKDYKDFVAPDAQESRAFQNMWSELRKGSSVTEKYAHVGRDKNTVWFRSSYSPILNDDGKPTRVMVIASDITETVEQRKLADELQEQQSAEQATVVSALTVGLNSLSDGDLTAQIEDDFAPQYEQLKIDFNRATAQLNKLIQSVIASAAGISGNSKEMSQAADDLAHRTESQAATLEETAAALEELTASVKSASEGAKQASDVVAGAKENAEASGEVVQMAVTAMDEIEKSSEHITQIIGVIEDIAFQTNLLALNAGVEAARAGDAGRGFAVVASEVRALAQRSSDAANEIKSIISTSAEHVESGVKLVNRAGDALKQILASVTDINGLVLEIASSSNEQSTGISEINSAVNQMDKGTQQNAAMVEETTAACHALNQETGELVGLVSKFKTSAEDDEDAQWKEEENKSRNSAAADEKLMFRSRKAPAAAGSAALNIDQKNADVDGWHDF